MWLRHAWESVVRHFNAADGAQRQYAIAVVTNRCFTLY